MKNSHIEWTDHTFNPWIGCTKVSPGCAHCYAETRDQRFAKGIHWGKGAARQRTSPANWKQPLKWNRDASAAHIAALHSTPAGQPCALPRPRVFCASLADWLDDEVPIEWLIDLLELVRTTVYLDWLLLTKRPENWKSRLTGVLKFIENKPTPATNSLYVWVLNWTALDKDQKTPSNLWIGTTVEDQARADERIPKLLDIPARIRFLSCEPLLEAVDLTKYVLSRPGWQGEERYPFPRLPEEHRTKWIDQIDWVICGGESGPDARPMHPGWARDLRDQCKAAEVPFLFKQWGEWAPYQVVAGGDLGGLMRKGRVLHLCLDRENDGHFRKGDAYVEHVGKKDAGRLLDGIEHNGFPREAA